MTHWYEYRWQKGFSRYYKIFIYKDLLGSWVLTSAWGGLQNRLGGYKHSVFNTIEDALMFVELMKKRRFLRGYNLVIN